MIIIDIKGFRISAITNANMGGILVHGSRKLGAVIHANMGGVLSLSNCQVGFPLWRRLESPEIGLSVPESRL
jgi:hypothetical protein